MTSKFSRVWPLTFDLQRSPEIKNISAIREPIQDFLYDFYWHFLSISYRFWDIRLQSFWGLTLTFEFQRSPEVKNIFTIRKPIHAASDSTLKQLTTCEVSNTCTLHYFLSNFYWHFLSRTVFEIFDFKVFVFWNGPWPLTFRGHPRSKIFSPFERMTFYLIAIDTFSLSRIVFEIFDFKMFGVWPWPLTLRGHPRLKIFFSIRKLIQEFLSNFYWNFRSITHSFWGIRLQSFWSLTLTYGL